jgi:hypothetical protein
MPATAKKKTARIKTTVTDKRHSKKPAGKKDLSATYNQFKVFEGKQYTGMQVGRSHNWNYAPVYGKKRRSRRISGKFLMQ